MNICRAGVNYSMPACHKMASSAKEMLDSVRQSLQPDLSAFDMEVFPKQVQLTGKGLGNLVKLPLGIHRLTGKRSYFIECVDRGLDAQLDFLARIRPDKTGGLPRPSEKTGEKNLYVHPRWQKSAEDYPDCFGWNAVVRPCPCHRRMPQRPGNESAGGKNDLPDRGVPETP